MPHADSLIVTLVGGFVLAFVLGMLANRLKLSPLVGYLVAGVVVGPFTPGYVADTELAPQLAEIGVILLMFGVGLHFSPKDLLQSRKVALPGALVQISAATIMGWLLGHFLLGLGHTEAVLLGFSLSVASTVVLLRALEERKQVKGEIGKIAVGWLIVEDLVIVVALVMLPLLVLPAGQVFDASALASNIGVTLVKVAAFVLLMFVVGGKVLPWLLCPYQVARTVHPWRAVYRSWHRMAGLRGLRGLVRAGGFRGRTGPERHAAGAQCGRAVAAAARCLRRAVFRIGGDVV